MNHCSAHKLPQNRLPSDTFLRVKIIRLKNDFIANANTNVPTLESAENESQTSFGFHMNVPSQRGCAARKEGSSVRFDFIDDSICSTTDQRPFECHANENKC